MNTNETMAHVIRLMEEIDIPYEIRPDGTLSAMITVPGSALCMVRLCARMRGRICLMHAISPVDTPPDCRDEMLEFVSRINAGQRRLLFEYDPEDGGLSFRTSIDMRPGRYTQEALDARVERIYLLLECALKGITGPMLEVMYGGDAEECAERALDAFDAQVAENITAAETADDDVE